MNAVPSLVIVVPDAVLAAVLRSEAKAYPDSVIITNDLPRPAGHFNILAVPAPLYLDSPTFFCRQVIFVYGPPALLPLCYTKGCADFIKEPWSLSELLFKMRRFTVYPRYFPGLPFSIACNCLCCGTQVIPLTAREEIIFQCLARNYGQIVSREHLQALLDAVCCSADPPVETRAVDIHIARVRKKLAVLQGQAAAYPVIRTVYNRGYALVIQCCG